METADIPLTPEERFSRVASILATGLLRLKAKPGLAIPGGAPAAEHEPPEESFVGAQNCLEVSAPSWPHPPGG